MKKFFVFLFLSLLFLTTSANANIWQISLTSISLETSPCPGPAEIQIKWKYVGAEMYYNELYRKIDSGSWSNIATVSCDSYDFTWNDLYQCYYGTAYFEYTDTLDEDDCTVYYDASRQDQETPESSNGPISINLADCDGSP